MKHLSDEEIARMIEGNVSGDERKEFLTHISRCKTCATIYSDTAAFIETDIAPQPVPKPPISKEISLWWCEKSTGIFKNPRYVLALAATILLVVVSLYLLWPELGNSQQDKDKIAIISGYVAKITSNENNYAFSSGQTKESAALFTGIFIEDISFLLKTSTPKELKTAVGALLKGQLKIFTGDKHPMHRDIEKINQENIAVIIQQIEQSMKESPTQKELPDYPTIFRIGRFVEQSLLGTAEGKLPDQTKLKEYLPLLEKSRFPHGTIKKLGEIQGTAEPMQVNLLITSAKKYILD